MNFPEKLFPALWYVLGFLPLLGVWAWCLRTAPWRRLASNEQLHVFLGTTVCMMLFWSMKAGVQPGLDLHMIGATVLVLTFGPQLAVLSLSMVLAAITFNGNAAWSAYALNATMMAVLPVLFSHALFRCAERCLPSHFFVYVFVNGFLNAGLTILLLGAGTCAVLWLAGVYSAEHLTTQYLPFFLLLAFSEAWLTGIAMTLLVVYRPQWVGTFDDARYLINK